MHTYTHLQRTPTTQLHTRTHTYTEHIDLHTLTSTHLHSEHVHTYLHAHTYNTHTLNTPTPTHTYIRTHTYSTLHTHTYIHTEHTHTYIRTHTYRTHTTRYTSYLPSRPRTAPPSLLLVSGTLSRLPRILSGTPSPPRLSGDPSSPAPAPADGWHFSGDSRRAGGQPPVPAETALPGPSRLSTSSPRDDPRRVLGSQESLQSPLPVPLYPDLSPVHLSYPSLSLRGPVLSDPSTCRVRDLFEGQAPFPSPDLEDPQTPSCTYPSVKRDNPYRARSAPEPETSKRPTPSLRPLRDFGRGSPETHW